MRCQLLPAAFVLAAAVDAQQWTTLDGPQYLGRAAAFDTHRLRLVVFSGDGETWEYDGDQLLHRPRLVGAPAPPPRLRAQMAYDALRRHVLMFGGDANNSSLGDTWTFDGARWTQLLAGPSPPPRTNAAITFDGARGRVLMHGGNLLAGSYSDTWEHDGTQWLQRSPATVPGQYAPVMAFDSGRSLVVMVTHPSLLGPVSTWEWNGVDWLLRTSAGWTPTALGIEALAYDPVRQRTVMVGGAQGGDEVWEWGGTAWTQRATVMAPLRVGAASWFDPVAGKVVVVGGTDMRNNGTGVILGSARTDAFEWNGSALTPRRPDHRPPSRSRHAWFADPIRRQILLFGGVRENVDVAEMWCWHDDGWTRPSPANEPPPRSDAATTFDWMRGVTLLFGGELSAVSGVVFRDLWAWNGTYWVQPGSGLVAPSARSSAGFCFDIVRGVAVLFGGRTGGTRHNDTWEWNGVVWTQRPTTVQPTPRDGPAMAFDIARSRVVLFGGRGGPPVSDTWEWDGAQWIAIQPAAAPPALVQPSLNYDFVRSRSVLSGALQFGGLSSYELWEYDGLTWTSIATSLADTLVGPAAIDAAHNRLLVASGIVLSEWSTQPSAVAEYGNGCGTPAPVLLARARPRIGEASFGVELGVGPGQLVGFVFAETQANVPVGNGCTLLFGQPAVSVLGIAGGTGVASVSFAIPDTGVLHGYVLFAQAGVLDPASPGGFRLTQGLRFAFGD